MPLFIHSDVELLPTLAPLFSMLLGVPFSLTTHLQSRAVHDEAQRSIWQIRDALPDFNGPIAARQGGVVGDRQIQVHQPQD